jgi:hypothetical protein
MRSMLRGFRRPLIAAAPALILLAAAPALASQSGILFTGGGSATTPEGAIFGAIDDAQVSASALQLYTCELVGEPRVFQYPGTRRPFAAEADMFCTP